MDMNLQRYLNPGREANFKKVNTVTTQINSLRQGKNQCNITFCLR